jgi:hypothetical protein
MSEIPDLGYSRRDDGCIGAHEGEYEPDGCPHAPVAEIAGDFVCRHHLLRVLRWRRAQVGHAVLVELIDV